MSSRLKLCIIGDLISLIVSVVFLVLKHQCPHPVHGQLKFLPVWKIVRSVKRRPIKKNMSPHDGQKNDDGYTVCGYCKEKLG